MIKDTVISALAAGLILDKLSEYLTLDAQVLMSLWIALTVILFIFCLFLEILAEKWRQHKARVQQLWQMLEDLRSGKEGNMERAMTIHDRVTAYEEYEAKLQIMPDTVLRREWDEESALLKRDGDDKAARCRKRQIEHEMAMRYMKTPIRNEYYLGKFLDLPKQFMDAYNAADWFRAKYIYEQALIVGMFLEIPVPLRKEFFGISDEDEDEIKGMIPRDLVSQVYLECAVKNNLGRECIVYRIPGEIGFYGAKPAPGTRYMKAEENPASWVIQGNAVIV